MYCIMLYIFVLVAQLINPSGLNGLWVIGGDLSAGDQDSCFTYRKREGKNKSN